MQKTFRSVLSGLYRKLPTLCAELRHSVGHCPRGAAVYIVAKPDVEVPFVEVLAHTRLNRIVRIDVKWESLRHPEIRDVRSAIAERCWRGTKEQTQQAIAEMKERIADKSGTVDPFAPDVEV